jgi:hypothetical protein
MNISSDYNKLSGIDLEKERSAYQFTPDERAKLFETANTRNEERNDEIRDFRDPSLFKDRLESAYTEIQKEKIVPAVDLDYTMPEQGKLPTANQINAMAYAQVQGAHDSRLQGIEDRYEAATKDIMREAFRDGRGPDPDRAPEVKREPEREPERTADISHEWDRAQERR